MPNKKQLANAIRALSMDGVQQANSGHPGAPMGMADIAEVLWNDFLKISPTNDQWLNRDRFVLSNGHGSMLLYSLLHLTGFDVSIDDLKDFRQIGSKTAGHPEYGHLSGIETTTGPLGQGITNAVGMAIAEKALAGQFNQPGHEIVDHYTYSFLGDGCLMEGISHEACSLAGTLKLGKLIAFYDDNGISIDGEVDGWFTDDSPQRFESYQWHVIKDVDGHDGAAIAAAIKEAQQVTDKPTLICCKTVIGFGSPNKQGKEDCHGAALGEAEVALTRENLGWEHPAFHIPQDIYDVWDKKEAGKAWEAEWNTRFDAYQAAHPELAAELLRRVAGELPADWEEKTNAYIKECSEKADKVASRKASQNTLNAFGPLLPEFMGGSADLAPSNLTIWNGSKGTNDNDDGNYVYYGVREFAMCAIMNGVYLHGGFRPYGGTFLVFSDYARNALRMAALMELPIVYVFTHDSIGLGEDGPTHQPVEHVASLRVIPNMNVWRPCDTVETAAAWKYSIESKKEPVSLALSRQGLPCIPRTDEQLANIAKGGYVLIEPTSTPEAIVIATGSEVELAVKAAEELNAKGKSIRVVSMPSVDTFKQQGSAYKESVLPASIKARVAVEAGVSDSWYQFVGIDGKVVGIDSFGQSGTGADLFKHYGFTVENVVKNIIDVIS